MPGEELATHFEEGSESLDFEIVDGEAPQEPQEEDVKLSKKEHAELLAARDAGSTVAKSVSELVAEMRGRPAERIVVQQAQQPQTELTDEEIEAAMFSGNGNAVKTVRNLFAREAQGIVQQFRSELEGLHQGQLLRDDVDERDAEVIREYRDEFNALLESLPASQRGLKQSINWARDKVKANHVYDIAAKIAAKTTEDSSQGTKPKASSPHMEGKGMAAAATPVAKKIYVTEADKQLAALHNLRFETKEDKASFYAWKARKGIK